jgi:DeoR family transcriptional regulator, ulaG and ulaABCDEF operon transcriptional repressor
VRDLQEALGVSAATVRRDIDKLHDLGQARKVYGGISAANALDRLAARPYDESRDIAVEAKRAIAERASALISDGDSVIVCGGSTCYGLGVLLAHRNVRLYTNSMPLAAFLGEQGTCHLTLAGGDLYREPRVIHDPGGPQPAYYASKFFVGTQGISADGLHESHPLLVRAIRQLSQCADEIVLLADSRKFSIRARHQVLPLARVGTLVTDDQVSDADVRMVSDAGVSVLVAHRRSTPLHEGQRI